MTTAACAANSVSNGGAMARPDQADRGQADNSAGCLLHLLLRKVRRTPHRALDREQVPERSSNRNLKFRLQGLNPTA